MRPNAKINKLAHVITAVALTIFAATSASAEMPSSKSAVAYSSSLTALGLASQASTSSSNGTDTGYLTILQSYIKTANQKDLVFDVALQCAIITDTTVKSKGGNKDEAEAYGKTSVRVKLTSMGTGEIRYADPLAEKGVTYCSRVQRLDAKFSGLNCTVDLDTASPTYGQVTCEDPEDLRLLLDTLNANAFNFVEADVTSGVWRIEVQARSQTNVTLGGSSLGSARAESFVGLGSMSVSESRLIKDADTGPIVEIP